MTKKHGRHSENSIAELRTKVKRTAIVAALVMTVGCTVVGTGTRTVIKAEGASDYAAKLLPGYVVPKGAQPSSRVAVFKDNVEPSRAGWFSGGGRWSSRCFRKISRGKVRDAQATDCALIGGDPRPRQGSSFLSDPTGDGSGGGSKNHDRTFRFGE